MHTLGSVMPGAPHSSPAGHCDDGADRMCYLDGTVVTLLSICPANQGAIFDCGDDDYFNPRPPAGSYLAGNWNTANSSFLAATDGIPRISINDLRVREGNNAVFTVSLDTPSASAVSVDYATANGSAAAGQDYVPTSGTLTIAPGLTQGQIVVAVNADGDKEGDETFYVNLSRAVGGFLVDGQGVGVIAGTRLGYWFVATDGGIFAFGDAKFYGSTGGRALPHPIIGMATTPAGGGYWLVGSGGELYAFGNAPDLGSLPAPPSAPIVAVSASTSGNGLWMAGADGRVYPRGDAADLGSAVRPRDPVVGIAATPSGAGYWLVTRGGQVLTFGDAPNKGSTPPPARPIVGMTASPTGQGYWICGTDGGIFAFGDAPFLGSTGNIRLNKPVVGMTAVG
jgi:hypothetical protein